MIYTYKGALTSKPYSFIARPWEYKSINTVDFFDSLNSSIRIDIRGDKIIRILPRINEFINEEWISDKIRFCVDGLRSQRVDKPIFLKNIGFEILNWNKVIKLLFKIIFLQKNNFKERQFFSNFKHRPVSFLDGVFGDFQSAILINFLTKTSINKLLERYSFKSQLNLSLRDFFFSNFKFKNLNSFDFFVLCGVNSRYESPIFNIRLRQGVTKNGLKVISFGNNFKSNFFVNFLGGVITFYNFISGKHWICTNVFKSRFYICFNFLFHKFINFIPIVGCPKVNIYNNLVYGFMSRHSSFVPNNEVGSLFTNLHEDTFSYCNIFLGLPNFNNHKLNKSLINHKTSILKNNINIIFAHHGDNRLSSLDLVIPNSAPFERESFVINNEGLVQMSRAVIAPPKNVLDISESVILVLGNLFKKNKGKLLDFSIFLSTFYSVITKDKIITWRFVNKFFSLISRPLSLSLFIKDLIIPCLVYLNNSGESLKTFSIDPKFKYKNVLTNRPTEPFFAPIESFYVQDEISASSFSLLSADERLTNKNTYN